MYTYISECVTYETNIEIGKPRWSERMNERFPKRKTNKYSNWWEKLQGNK